MTTTTANTYLDNRITDIISERMKNLVETKIRENNKKNTAHIERVAGFVVCYHTYFTPDTVWCGDIIGCEAYIEIKKDGRNLLVLITVNNHKEPFMEVYSEYKKSDCYTSPHGRYHDFHCTAKHKIFAEYL